MKRLLLPLLAALALPTAVNAEVVELVNDGKYKQYLNTYVIPIGLRKGDWINADISTSIYDKKGKRTTYRSDRMQINCKSRILEINWGALTLRRKENGFWEETWKKYARHSFMRVLVPPKEPKQFNAGGFLIFQETAEGAYNSLCKK